MDYEKKYNDALERARALWREAIEKEYPNDYLKDYETIFPELRESEDERIRRTLVEYFGPKVQLDFVRGIPIQKIRDWLEKQKEQKPDIEICPHSIKSKSYSETGYPIEDCDYGLEIALDILEKTIGKVYGFQTDDGIREHQTAIKAVKDAMKEQKPAECIEDSVKFEEGFKAGRESGLLDGQKYVLNNLDSYGLCKPAWSEEDEKMLTGIIERGSVQVPPYTTALREEQIEWLMNRLKSLRTDTFQNGNSRPKTSDNWKPSEEQMKALQHAIDACESEWAYQDDELRSLLNDLKKL